MVNIVRFEQFLEESCKNEEMLKEAPSTPQAKVESVIRSLKLKYTIDKSDKDTAFFLENGYTLNALNNGDVTLSKMKDKVIAKIPSHELLDATKIMSKVEDFLKKNAPELFGKDDTSKDDKKTA